MFLFHMFIPVFFFVLFCKAMSVLHFILMTCFIVLRDTGDGGWTISSLSFVFRTGGSLVSFATMEKSNSQHNTGYLIRGRRKSCNREGHIFFFQS